MNRAASIAALLLAAPALATAQVYRCVDKNGRVQYSQTKPTGADCQDQDASGPAPSGADGGSLNDYAKQLDKSRGDDAKARQKAEHEQKVQAQREQRCKSARSRANLLNQQGRLYIMDENGERHYQSDAEREALKAQAQETVARECG